MCSRNFIDFRLEYFKLKIKLETINDPNVERKLRNFIETKVYGTSNTFILNGPESTIKAERDVISIEKLEKNLTEKEKVGNYYSYNLHGIRCKTEKVEYEDIEEYKFHTEIDLENSKDHSELPIRVEHIKVESCVQQDIIASESDSTNECRAPSESSKTCTREDENHTVKDFTQYNSQKTGENEYEACKETFPYADNLEEHMRIHNSEKPFTCTVRNKSFTESNNSKKHQVGHISEKPYTCNICNKAYSQLRSLKAHECKHTGKMPHICDICNKSFSLLDRLKAHMLIHSNEKPYKCMICNKTFKRLDSLKGHKRVHTGEKPYVCRVCGKSYSALTTLKEHIRLHSGEKPYKCAVCNKRFMRLQSYKGHMLTHTGEKPYLCSVCKKAFTKSNHLKEHERIHTGVKPYACNICMKAFRLRRCLKLHEQKGCVQHVIQEKINQQSEET